MNSGIDSQIDFGLWFMPQRLTPLYFTSAYETLSPAQRLRYNQLHALYLNEQTIFFERALAPNVLGYFLKQNIPPKLRAAVEEFQKDEERHSAMFRTLNRLCAPDIYGAGDFNFIRVATIPAKLLEFIARRPRVFPMLLWLMYLQEERSLFIGRQFVKSDHPIEPHFLAAQRAHLADEVSHVHCDEELLDFVWPEVHSAIRFINIRLLAWMMREYFGAPKRAQVNVLAALVREFPDLQPRLAELRDALLQLRHDENFLRAMYSRENVPEAFARFDRHPELHPLAEVMPGYQPNYSL
jgi:hypothetical protein